MRKFWIYLTTSLGTVLVVGVWYAGLATRSSLPEESSSSTSMQVSLLQPPSSESIRADLNQAVTAGSVKKPDQKDWETIDPETLDLMHGFSQRMRETEDHPHKDLIREEMIAAILERQDGIRASRQIVEDIDSSLSTFGEEQAHARVLALRVLERAAEKDAALLPSIMQSIAQRLENRSEWIKGEQYDYRDLLVAYMRTKTFEDLQSDVEGFRAAIGFHDRLGTLVYRTVYNYFHTKSDRSQVSAFARLFDVEQHSQYEGKEQQP